METIYFLRIKEVDGTYAYYEKTYEEEVGFFSKNAAGSISWNDYDDICEFVKELKEDFKNGKFYYLDNAPEEYDLDSLELVEFVQTKVHKV